VIARSSWSKTATVGRVIMEGLEKCWEIKKCGKEHACKVFPHYGRSCWLIRGNLHSIVGDSEMACSPDCQSCEVYQWHMAVIRPISAGKGPHLDKVNHVSRKSIANNSDWHKYSLASSSIPGPHYRKRPDVQRHTLNVRRGRHSCQICENVRKA
jgi:hypothetical protein